MAKKTIIQQDFEDDEYEVISKKSKRRMAKAASRAQQQQQQQQSVIEEGDDTMSRVALLCQEERWREAVSLCHEALAKARAEGREDLEMTIEMALPKLEYSWRRQRAAVLISSSIAMLKKEYLLDVGE